MDHVHVLSAHTGCFSGEPTSSGGWDGPCTHSVRCGQVASPRWSHQVMLLRWGALRTSLNTDVLQTDHLLSPYQSCTLEGSKAPWDLARRSSLLRAVLFAGVQGRTRLQKDRHDAQTWLRFRLCH